MQRGRKPSIGIHRTAAEFHLYANSKPRCDPCFHLEIPARRVDPISRFHGTTYHPLPTTRRVRAPTNNWSILVFLSVGDSEQLIDAEFGRIRTNGFAFESYESSSPRQDNFRQRRRSTIVNTIYEYTISSSFESLLIIIETRNLSNEQDRWKMARRGTIWIDRLNRCVINAARWLNGHERRTSLQRRAYASLSLSVCLCFSTRAPLSAIIRPDAAVVLGTGAVAEEGRRRRRRPRITNVGRARLVSGRPAVNWELNFCSSRPLFIATEGGGTRDTREAREEESEGGETRRCFN